MKLYAVDIIIRNKDYEKVNECRCMYAISSKRLFLIPFAISLSDSLFTVEILVKYHVSIVDVFEELDKKKLISVITQLKIDSANVYKSCLSSCF